MTIANIRGLLFDKDGTLYDFNATWGAWAAKFIAHVTNGDDEAAQKLGDALHFDFVTKSFHPTSPFIAGTEEESFKAMKIALPHHAEEDIWHSINESQKVTETIPVGDLMALFQAFKIEGYKLGIATNAAVAAAIAQLDRSGLTPHFDYIAGYDSGHGAKPEPGMCLGFLAATGLQASECMMIGDSTHDLDAGRAAGMMTVAVLTGVATRDDLAAHADYVLPSIMDLPALLTGA